MDLIAQFELMSDAAQLAVFGAACWLVAVFATVMDRRRARVRDVAHIGKVGWVPWTTVFVLMAMLGAGLLAMSLPALMKG